MAQIEHGTLSGVLHDVGLDEFADEVAGEHKQVEEGDAREAAPRPYAIEPKGIEARNSAMKMTIEVDCTPEEARRFLGLPDVSVLNEHLVDEMKKRVDANMAMISPDELVKNWMSFGQGAQEQFRKLMEVGMNAAAPKK